MSAAPRITRTDAVTLLGVVIRAVVAWVAVSLLVSLPALWVSASRPEFGGTPGGAFPVAAVALAALGVLVLAWVLAGRIARLAVSRSKAQVFESEFSGADVAGFVLAAIGAWQLFTGIVASVRVAARWVVASRVDGYAGTAPSMVPDVLALVVQIALALVLLFASAGLARAMGRVGAARRP